MVPETAYIFVTSFGTSSRFPMLFAGRGCKGTEDGFIWSILIQQTTVYTSLAMIQAILNQFENTFLDGYIMEVKRVNDTEQLSVPFEKALI